MFIAFFPSNSPLIRLNKFYLNHPSCRTFITITIIRIINLPERPPDIEAHGVEPEERRKERKVHRGGCKETNKEIRQIKLVALLSTQWTS